MHQNLYIYVLESFDCKLFHINLSAILKYALVAVLQPPATHHLKELRE